MTGSLDVAAPLLDLLAFVLLEGRLCVIRVSISPETHSKSEKKPPTSIIPGDDAFE